KRVVKAQRSQPGEGRARTCAVSSTVGVHATGRRALKTVGGKASTASTSATVSTGSPSRNRNQPLTRGFPLGVPSEKPASSGCNRRSTLPMKGGGKVSVATTATHSSGGGRPGGAASTSSGPVEVERSPNA